MAEQSDPNDASGSSDTPEPLPAALPIATAEAEQPDGIWTVLALTAALAIIFLVHAPVLGHYLFGDDFVPLAEVASQSTWEYVKNLLLLEDVNTNWRFLPGLYYMVVFEAFGTNAVPYLVGSVLVHVATAALIFWLVRRELDARWPASFAAVFFGLSAASVPTVGQVTAFNNVLAGFFIMLAIVTLYEGLERRQLVWWGSVSALAFAAAIAANESAAVVAPLFALIALWKVAETDTWWGKPDERLRFVAPTAVFGLIGGAALVAFAVCDCTEISNDDIYGVGGHIFGNTWIYLGQLLFPVGYEAQPGEVELGHLVAGIVVALVSLVALVRGPALARIAVLFLGLILIPYLPLSWTLAPRSVYLATIPFSLLAACFFVWLARLGARYAAAPAVLAVLALGALALNGWQTWELNESFSGRTEVWRELVTGLEERFPELEEGSHVYVFGGSLTKPDWQLLVLPAVGDVLWRDVSLRSVPATWPSVCSPRDGDVFAVAYDDGQFNPLTIVKINERGERVPDLGIGPQALVRECRVRIASD